MDNNKLVDISIANDESWHQGELSIQKRVGTAQRMAEVGPTFIRQFMPKQHQDFFASLSMIFIAYAGSSSTINASVLFGEPGFIYPSSDTELIINTQNRLSDFDNNLLKVGDKLGLLGIVFESKRRNRVNVIITDISQKTIKVQVLQSYGNCPKYIQPKTFKTNINYSACNSIFESSMTDAIHKLIVNSDTFFIASQFDDGNKQTNRGADISHRGGKPGFISIDQQGRLLVPDYAGNGFFNTLGNLSLEPLASLLFCDFKNGDAVQITVSSHIIWQDNDQRLLVFTPLKIWLLKNSLAYILN